MHSEWSRLRERPENTFSVLRGKGRRVRISLQHHDVEDQEKVFLSFVNSSLQNIRKKSQRNEQFVEAPYLSLNPGRCRVHNTYLDRNYEVQLSNLSFFFSLQAKHFLIVIIQKSLKRKYLKSTISEESNFAKRSISESKTKHTPTVQ